MILLVVFTVFGYSIVQTESEALIRQADVTSTQKIDAVLHGHLQSGSDLFPQVIVQIEKNIEEIESVILANGARVINQIDIVNSLVVDGATPALISELIAHPQVRYLSADVEITMSGNNADLLDDLKKTSSSSQRMMLSQVNQSVEEQTTVVLGEEIYEKTINVILDQKFERFTSDAIATLNHNCDSVKYAVALDGEEVFASPKLTSSAAKIRVDISAANRSQMTLKISQTGAPGACNKAEATWPNAWLYMPQTKYQDNLLVNGDFSRGLTGWLVSNKHNQVQMTYGPDRFSGTSLKI
ncbi:MAG: NPCBM/NEW2 domain-containing protein, partial [Chloroflexota bacterium]